MTKMTKTDVSRLASALKGARIHTGNAVYSDGTSEITSIGAVEIACWLKAAGFKITKDA